jgi:hypothetical protein
MVVNYARNHPHLGHLDGTPERTKNTSTQNKEGGVGEELVSGSTKEQQSVGRSLFGIITISQLNRTCKMEISLEASRKTSSS